jgi:ABC-type uncharacterized transport system substrate-binding protein
MRIYLCAAVLLLLFPATAFAHPVVTIRYRLDFRLDASGLRGISETWVFDAVHSAQILKMFDTNGDGRIESSELPSLERGYFDDLKHYSYFTTVVIDGKEAKTGNAQDFSADFDPQNHRMVYHFYLPLVVKAEPRDREVDITIWDPTYFTDLEPVDASAIRLSKPRSISATIHTGNDHRHFYNIAPDVILIRKPPFYLPMQVLKFRTSG